MTKIPVSLIRRILLERDLSDSRTLDYELPSGEVAEFTINTISQEEKQSIRKRYDKFFPTPPVIHDRLGIPQFDLEDAKFQEDIHEWNQMLSRGVLAATLGITDEEVTLIEQSCPRVFVNKLFATIELLNGIQSDPLVELVKEAIWAPEVMSWLETSVAPIDTIKVTDTPLYREMESMTSAGLDLDQWENLSPRHKIMYINFHTYKQAREAYIQEMTEKKSKKLTRGM